MTQEEIAAQVSEQINQIAPELTKTNWDRLLDTGLDYLVLAAKALIVLAVGYFLIRWLLKISKRGLKRSHISKTLHAFILSTIKIVDYVFLILIVMSVLGIPTTSLITAVGTAGVAIGLALKDSLSNFASGVLLLERALQGWRFCRCRWAERCGDADRPDEHNAQDPGQPAHRGAEQYGCQIDDHQLFDGKAEAFGFELCHSWQG